MGLGLSNLNWEDDTDPRPSSILECCDIDGKCDPTLYYQYQQRLIDEDEREMEMERNKRLHNNDGEDEDDEDAPKPKRKREPRRTEEDDKCDPTNSFWYRFYIARPTETLKPRVKKNFRRRFRLPIESFFSLVEKVKGNARFLRWMGTDAIGRPASSIELLLLGTLRILGRAVVLDEVEEHTGISRQVHGDFFHKFTEFGANELALEYIVFPTTAEEAAEHMADYAAAGVHGAVGSTDATHIMSEMIPLSLAQYHKSHKLHCASRTYNLTCNHRRRILHTSPGHPARWNDKTIVRFDEFVTKIHEGDILDDVTFDLYYRDTNNVIQTQKYRGPWLLVDNGYLNWSTTLPPYKRSTSYAKRKWSEYAESMRKDVECTFGILKGRWRILKTPIRFHGTDIIDNIWKTCCALHNMLLDVDGLAKNWQAGARSDWEGSLGHHERGTISAALLQLYNNQDSSTMDVSGMGPGSDMYDTDKLNSSSIVSDEPEVGSDENDSSVRVRSLRFEDFRTRMVEHFDICRERNEVHWPRAAKRG